MASEVFHSWRPLRVYLVFPGAKQNCVSSVRLSRDRVQSKEICEVSEDTGHGNPESVKRLPSTPVSRRRRIDETENTSCPWRKSFTQPVDVHTYEMGIPASGQHHGGCQALLKIRRRHQFHLLPDGESRRSRFIYINFIAFISEILYPRTPFAYSSTIFSYILSRYDWTPSRFRWVYCKPISCCIAEKNLMFQVISDTMTPRQSSKELSMTLALLPVIEIESNLRIRLKEIAADAEYSQLPIIWNASVHDFRMRFRLGGYNFSKKFETLIWEQSTSNHSESDCLVENHDSVEFIDSGV